LLCSTQHGARTVGADHVKSEDAKKRADSRSSKEKGKKGVKGQVGREEAKAIIKPSINEELTFFKAIVRQIAKHELAADKAKLFQAEERVHLRRLAKIGVLGHQPAIAAVTQTSPKEKGMLERAIASQKIGHNAKTEKQIKEFYASKAGEAGAGEAEQIKIRKAKLALPAPVRWKMIKADASDEEKDAEENPNARRAGPVPEQEDKVHSLRRVAGDKENPTAHATRVPRCALQRMRQTRTGPLQRVPVRLNMAPMLAA
jgi:hypothetical protein